MHIFLKSLTFYYNFKEDKIKYLNLMELKQIHFMPINKIKRKMYFIQIMKMIKILSLELREKIKMILFFY